MSASLPFPADAGALAPKLARALCALLTTAAILAFVLISPMVLHLWGVNYELPGGTAFEKIHPGAWLVFAALALVAINFGNPVAYFAARGSQWPGLPLFLGVWLILLQHIVLVQHAPFTPIFDSFLMPMALFLCLRDMPAAAQRNLAILLHIFMLANALLGLYEVGSGWRLTPFTAVDLEVELDWRATAFLGHPLTNACMSGVYCLLLALGGGRDMPALLRPLALLLQLIAMVAFGGRASLVLLLALLAFAALRGALRLARGRPASLLQAGMIIMLLPLAVIAVDQAIEFGFFDRFIDRFVNDRGSARARIVMFDLLARFSWGELLAGPDQDILANLQRLEGVEYGIESFWVGFVLSYGVIISSLFFIGLLFFCRDLVRATRPGTSLILIFFFSVASTSVSLSAKSTLLGLLIAFIMPMLRQDHSGHRLAGRV